MKRFFPYLAVVIAMLCWSVSGIAIKQALLVLPPFTMIVMRFTLAVLLMLLIGLFFHKNKMLRLQVLSRKDIPLFFLAGVFQPFLYYLLETFSYDALGSPTIAEALLSTSPLLSPLFAAVLGFFFFGEIPGVLVIVGGCVIIGGILWYSKTEG